MLKVYTDGASRGNPGLAGAGIIILDEKGIVISEVKKFLGVKTNNAAEYSALILSVEAIRNIASNIKENNEVCFYSDSQLMVNQITGRYKVKDPGLSKLYEEFISKVKSMKLKYTAVHIPRNENKLADKLANRAIDERDEQQTFEFK